MARTAWRIAADTRNYTADDLSGRGAEEDGGRWNHPGTPLLYASSTIALACLETFVHLDGRNALPLNRYLVQLELPPSTWRQRTVFVPADHVGWDAEPPGLVSMGWGTQWAQSQVSLIAEVPSVVVPEEINILINPRHRDTTRLKARKLRRWAYDRRVRGGQ
jgi:RES domain-containing protein